MDKVCCLGSGGKKRNPNQVRISKCAVKCAQNSPFCVSWDCVSKLNYCGGTVTQREFCTRKIITSLASAELLEVFRKQRLLILCLISYSELALGVKYGLRGMITSPGRLVKTYLACEYYIILHFMLLTEQKH